MCFTSFFQISVPYLCQSNHVNHFTLNFSISDIRLDPSTNSNYGSRGALTWTPPASVEGSTPTWTEGTPSFTDSSSSGDMGKLRQIFGTIHSIPSL